MTVTTYEIHHLPYSMPYGKCSKIGIIYDRAIPYYIPNDGYYILGEKRTLSELSEICKIPEDEAIILKLKYGP